MADLITPEIEDLIGVDWPSVVHEIEAPGIRMWARAVGYDDPVFYDEGIAHERGFDRLPAPPGFLGTPVSRPGDPDPGPPLRGLNPALTRSLNGGTEYTHVRPVLAGDRLTATTRIVEVKQREGSIGEMLLITRETTYRRGEETVATLRATVINY